MAPSLDKVLELPVLRMAEVLGGASWGDRRVVGVSVIEVPVEGFVGRGELILSTAMGVGHDEALLMDFVGEVAASGAVALVLNCGPYLPGVPERVVRLTEKLGLPLLKLPWEVRFADVIEAVLRLVLEDQRGSEMREEFAWSLARGGYASPEIAVAQGQRLGYNLRQGHVCAVGRLELSDPSRSAPLAREVLDLALRTGRGDLRVAVGATASESILVFVRAEEPAQLDPLLAMISQRTRELGLPAVSWGVGDVAWEVSGFQHSYSEAGIAATIGRSSRGEGSITHVGQTGASRVLMTIASLPESRDLQARFLEPLLAYEERAGVPLVQTLQALFETGGNLSECARQLHLHRHSLKNRLEMVESLLRGTLADPEMRFALEMAVRLRRMDDSPA